ncbi:MAG: AraC family transcriptional regulator [Pygmaiobacter sp.]|nr:AraC family transcriptional regulator [Pygmaiobacter sp.]
MKRELRAVHFDAQLQLEAYHFQGLLQKFPPHFHDYYVIGYIESGKRSMQCNGVQYTLAAGDMVLFNPGDVHACAPLDGRALGYCNLNIPPKVLQQAAFEITGRRQMPHFGRQVLFRSELVPLLREVHGMVLKGEQDFHKEELFYFLLSQLLEESAPAIPQAAAAAQVQAVCDYLDQNYSETITLQQLSALTGWSKYHLLRTFTRQKGITPYSYLETVRVAQAKRLLVQGVCPMDAALRTGFSDQSHFSNFFKKFIGLTPGQYQSVFRKEAVPPATAMSNKEE